MDRPDLELVLAVRQHGSLVMAARALHVAPSAVTKRLAALEARDPEAATKAIQADLVWGGKIMIDWLVEREKELDYRPPGPRK